MFITDLASRKYAVPLLVRCPQVRICGVYYYWRCSPASHPLLSKWRNIRRPTFLALPGLLVLVFDIALNMRGIILREIERDRRLMDGNGPAEY